MSSAEFERKRQSIIRAWLDKWNGGSARLWEYSVSHKRLVIRMTHPEIVGNLHVCCGDTTYICANTTWDNAGLMLEVQPENQHDLQYILLDKSKEFRIVCGVIEVKENVKPI